MRMRGDSPGGGDILGEKSKTPWVGTRSWWSPLTSPAPLLTPSPHPLYALVALTSPHLDIWFPRARSAPFQNPSGHRSSCRLSWSSFPAPTPARPCTWHSILCNHYTLLEVGSLLIPFCRPREDTLAAQCQQGSGGGSKVQTLGPAGPLLVSLWASLSL